MVERRITTKNYVLSFIITGLIFLSAFLFGMLMDRVFIEHVEEFTDESRLNLFRLELREKLLEDDMCGYEFGSSLDDEFMYITNEIIHLESKLGKNNEKVLRLKEYYSLLEIYDWLHYKSIKNTCGGDYDLVLYFYSNENEECDCDQQGFILDYVKENNPSVRVYSFDYNMDLEETNLLKIMYNIQEVPTIIINDNVLQGFRELEDIEYFL